MKNVLLKPFYSSLLEKLFILCIFVSSVTLHAENIFITSFCDTGNVLTPAPHSESSGFSLAGASSASMSTASPSPGVSPRRVLYGLSPGAFWKVTPTDGAVGASTFTALQNLGVYKIYLTKGQSGNASTNIIVNMTATGGDLSDASGAGMTEVPLDLYQRAKPNHTWVHAGYITNTSLNPTITLTHASGAIDNNADITLIPGQRWYVDAIRFEFVDQCNGVATQVGIGGPLAHGQAFVNTFDVVNGATNVVVYADGAEIGRTNSPTGFPGGTVAVLTTALVKGQIITAMQVKNGCASIVSSSGPQVGGGANPQIRALLGLWQNSSLTGPVGANGATNGSSVNYFVKATGLTGGFGTGFQGGETLVPSQCWQTVSFNPDDPNFTSAGTSVPPGDPFAALSGVAFAIGDTDSGPYEIYVDRIMNGDVVIEDFESYAVGSTNTFNAPKAAVLPAPNSTYLAGHNSSVVSQNNAFDGTKSSRLQWQWPDSSNIRWAHILANAPTGKYFPQIDLTKPITIRYLVLPVGQTTNKLSFSSFPVSQTKSVGQSVTLSVGAAGEGPFTYQWQFAGSDIASETSSSYTKSNLQVADTGDYSVIVTGNGGTGCVATNSATVTVTDVVTPPTITYTRSGDTVTLNWTGTGFTLQQATALTGSPSDWSDVAGATSGHVVNTATGTKYFRLKQ